MKIIRILIKYAGVTAIPVYVAFTFASHLHNTAIHPLRNWLSDYGNPLINPEGALLYNAGCVAVALLLAAFYTGLTRWYRGQAKKFVVSFAVAQISGMLGSVFLILTTVFPLGARTELHSAFSTANMIAMDCLISFTAVGLLLKPEIPKAIGIFGFLASTFNIVTMNAFHDFYLAEWIFFALFMAYVTLLTAYYDRLSGLTRARKTQGI